MGNYLIMPFTFYPLIILGAIAIIWYTVSTILIYENLRERGFDVSFLFLRFFAIKYAQQYKEATKKETGQVGPLFYHWIISINAALLIFILYFLTQVL